MGIEVGLVIIMALGILVALVVLVALDFIDALVILVINSRGLGFFKILWLVDARAVRHYG